MPSCLPGRLLICGPMLSAQGIGGLQAVFTDLAKGLAARGWDVDVLPLPLAADWRGAANWRSTLAGTIRRYLPDDWRLFGRVLMHDVGRLREQSDLLHDIERRIAAGGYSAIVACVDNAPVGLASLVTRVAPRHVLVSLCALTSELRRRTAIAVARRIARGVSRALHPDLLRPVDPASVQSAVFASRSWRAAGVAAGLDPRAAREIYFGVPVPARLPPARPVQSPLRLLWAARLGPEKGLHLFLPAVALVSRVRPVHLTVVDAGGPDAYRRTILDDVGRLQLNDVVSFRPAVSRDALPGLFEAHDVFLFYSIFAEPVAQMLLSAMAAGAVVVAPAPRAPAIIRPGETAICFQDERPSTIADAILQAARDEAARHRVRTRAFTLVGADHSLDRTLAEYDRLLTPLAGEWRQVRA